MNGDGSIGHPLGCKRTKSSFWFLESGCGYDHEMAVAFMRLDFDPALMSICINMDYFTGHI